jgi:hypothetical protein
LSCMQKETSWSRRLVGLWWRAFTLATCVTTVAIGEAARDARVEADALFERGKLALKTGDWDVACENFRHSLALDASPSTLVKIARCDEHGGRFRAAARDYERALLLISALPRDSAHARDLSKLAREAKRAVEARLGRLLVTWSPGTEPVRVVVDDEPVEPSSAATPMVLDPGEHVVTVTANGLRADPVRVNLAEGETRELRFELEPTHENLGPVVRPPLMVGAASKPAPTATSQAATPGAIRRQRVEDLGVSQRDLASLRHGGESQRLVGYVTGGAGAALLGISAYFGLKAQSLTNDSRAGNHCDANYSCDETGLERLSRASSAQTDALIFGAGSVVLLGTGIALLLTAPTSKKTAIVEWPRWAMRIEPGMTSVGVKW